MPNYRRTFIPGGTYFFTLVTYNRQPILTTENSRGFLHEAWKNVAERFPFTQIAVCLLPDHLHTIWALEGEDQDYPLRWHEIKRIFSLRYLQQVGGPETERHSHAKRKDAFLWQRRYWEHTIRDEQDMKAHLDYVHYNPVKHGLVDRVCDWPWSSFHRYVELGWYEKEWGDNQPLSDVDFGE